MKLPKIFHIQTSVFKSSEAVTAHRRQYNNSTLAVELKCATPPWEPYAVVTVNLVNSPYGDGKYQDETHAYIDTNNCPWAPEFLEKTGLAKPDSRDIYGMSGYCTYPLYEFNLDAFNEGEDD